MTVRCPGCGYALLELEGVPREPTAAFERDVACPECGLQIPAGSRVVVGGMSAYAMGGKASLAKNAYILIAVGILGLWWIQQVVSGVIAWTSGGTVDLFRVGTAFGALVFIGFVSRGLISSLRIRRARAVGGEVSDSDALMVSSRGYLFAPGWLVVFDRTAPRQSVLCVEARGVRTVRVIEDLSKDSALAREAAHEVTTRVDPPGPPATIPVFVRATADPAVLAASLLSSLRLPPAVDFSAVIERWKQSEGVGQVKVLVRRAGADGGREALAQSRGFESSSGAVRVAGSPHLPARVEAMATAQLGSSVAGASLLAGMSGGVGFIMSQGGFRSLSSVIPIVICVSTVAVVMFAQRKGMWSRYATKSEWRISRTGVTIVVDGRRTEIPAATIGAIDLVVTLGVPHFVVYALQNARPIAVIVPDDWGGVTPAEAHARALDALRGASAN
ncbi:MAG: hypothetical protein RLY21_1103 [Planctomycetota bacterium]